MNRVHWQGFWSSEDFYCPPGTAPRPLTPSGKQGACGLGIRAASAFEEAKYEGSRVKLWAPPRQGYHVLGVSETLENMGCAEWKKQHKGRAPLCAPRILEGGRRLEYPVEQALPAGRDLASWIQLLIAAAQRSQELLPPSFLCPE